MDAFFQDLRYAARSLAKSPGLTLAAVATLSLGIGTSTAMFGVVDRLFWRPPAHVVDPDRVVRLNVKVTMPPFGTMTMGVGTYPRYSDFRNHAKSFSAVAAVADFTFSLGLGEHAQSVGGRSVTASFFPLLGVRPALGRFFSSDEDRPGNAAHVVVLSHRFWRGHFLLDTAVLGKTLQLGRSVYTIIGVAPEDFSGIDLGEPDLWVPMSAAAPEVQWANVLSCEGCFFLTTIARLRPEVNSAQAVSEGTALYRGHYVQTGDSGAVMVLSPVHEALGPSLSTDAKLSLWLAIVCGIVLLIACANVANLLLARAVQRRREIALRAALGAGRGRLMRQLLAESALLATLGGGGALLITMWAGPVLLAVLLRDATAGPSLDPRVFAFTASIALFTAVLAGITPAWHASTPDLSAALKAGAREGAFQPSRTRTGLLIGQVALALVLLAGAGLFVTSLRNVQGLRLGFDADRVIATSVNLEAQGYKVAAINTLYGQMQDRVRRVPGVLGTSLVAGSSPFRSSWAVSLEVPGLDSLPPVASGGPYIAAVTPDYFRTMGTLLRRGRAFTEGDHAGSARVAVVNETMGRLYWPGKDPIGKCLKIGKLAGCTEVVGVVEDARRMDITDEVVVQYFVPLAQKDSILNSPVSILLVRTVGPAEQLVGAVRREVQATSPLLPYPSIDPMPQLFANQLRPWRLGSALLSLFGGLGLLLSAIGLYGVLSYQVSQRTQELGIRIALGAERRSLLGLIVAQGLKVTLAGLAFGLAGALVAGKAVASLLYGVSPRDPVVLAGVAVLLTFVAVLASYLPARRATKVDPMIALRYD